MCGYACYGCGKCGKKVPKKAVSIESVPGYCLSCGHLNGPTASCCSQCGTVFADSGQEPKKLSGDCA